MPLATPQALKLEHEEIHDALIRASREEGAVGEAAKRVARILHPHVEKEELFALPPLGLLEEVARGLRPASAGEALDMIEHLRDELETMLAEHHMILAAMEEFLELARVHGRVEYIELGSKLIAHIGAEGDVFYPAALLLGDYLKLRYGISAKPFRYAKIRSPAATA
jgi:hypothetical protein